jgi:UDP-N-acetylglucosamine 4,6-dehydratase/5-epimerase
MTPSPAPSAPPLADASILVTGGTGSFGQRLLFTLLDQHRPRRVVIFSRDELKQYELQQKLLDHPLADRVRFFLGDVRDRDRLVRAFDGVDYVVHAAALKQVPAAEYNPLEFIKTNILGAANIIEAAIDRNVTRVVALSTDKAANPVNLYGATKLCSDKLFVSASVYSGAHATRFCVVRYGNVMGSRGSVIPLFLRQRETGRLTITDERMTRFWISLQQGVDFVLDNLLAMHGGEIFVPKIPSMRVMDLAAAIAPGCETVVTGIRPGEKLHEVMVTEDDARNTLELPDRYVIAPSSEAAARYAHAAACDPSFRYASDTNDQWLTGAEMLALAGLAEPIIPSDTSSDARISRSCAG